MGMWRLMGVESITMWCQPWGRTNGSHSTRSLGSENQSDSLRHNACRAGGNIINPSFRRLHFHPQHRSFSFCMCQQQPAGLLCCHIPTLCPCTHRADGDVLINKITASRLGAGLKRQRWERAAASLLLCPERPHVPNGLLKVTQMGV